MHALEIRRSLGEASSLRLEFVGKVQTERNTLNLAVEEMRGKLYINRCNLW